MRQVSTDFENKMQENLRSWVPRMTIDGTEVSGDIQTGLTINLGSCGPEEFNIGTVFIPSITATISDCSTVLQNKEIKLEMGLVLDDGIEYVPVGYFTVEKPNKEKFATSFTAYGRLMSKMGGTYESALNYPTSINNVLSEISTQSGMYIQLIGLTGTGLIETKPEGLNHREAVQLIASLLGGFVTENSIGDIVICKYQLNDALTVDTSFCYQYPSVHDKLYKVTGLLVKTDLIFDGYSFGEPNITTTNGYMTESLFEVCRSNIENFSYMPGSVNFLGDIRLDPWDSLTVTDDDEEYRIPCMDIVHVWDGGLITTVQAPGTTEAEDESGFAGAMTREFERIVKTSIKQQDESISKIEQYVSSITLSVENGGTTSTIELKAGEAVISSKEIVFNGLVTITSLENGTTQINGACIETGSVIGSVKLQAPQIIGGTIYAGDPDDPETFDGYAVLTSTGLDVYNADNELKIKVGYTEGNQDYPYIQLGASTDSADGKGLFKKFADGVWIGNDAPMKHEGEFQARKGYNGIFVSFATNQTYVVHNTTMQNVYTGDTIARFG